MKKLIIHKGWYWSAGKRFGWREDGISDTGIGIGKQWLTDNKAIIVNVDKVDYHLDCEQALAFINKYKCYEDIGNTRIGYIPKELLTKLT